MKATHSSRVGLLTDVHYIGDAEDMNRLYEAVAILNREKVDLLVVMGDLIEASDERSAKRLLGEAASLCEHFEGPIHFMIGNHDLDHLSKAQFYNAIDRFGERPHFCFDQGGYNFICLDGSFSPDGTEYEQGNFQWQEAYIPEEQLDWLRGRLAASLLPIVILSHQRIDEPSEYSVVNDAAVCKVLQDSGKVRAVFQGHRHKEDFRELGSTSFYTLGAHKNRAGPAVVEFDEHGLRLIRDFHSLEPEE